MWSLFSPESSALIDKQPCRLTFVSCAPPLAHTFCQECWQLVVGVGSARQQGGWGGVCRDLKEQQGSAALGSWGERGCCGSCEGILLPLLSAVQGGW